MKLHHKTLASLLLVVILALTPLVAHATKFTEYATVKLTDVGSGQTASYPTVNLTIGHADVISDVPAILYTSTVNGQRDARTLVPLRVISESLGAHVNWEGAERRITIDYGELNIQLVIDEGQATINGQVVQMPSGVPAKLMTYQDTTRTLVPVRFVSELLGADIQWDADTRTVNIDRGRQQIRQVDFVSDDLRQQLFISTDSEVQPSTYYLAAASESDNSQLIIDIPNVEFSAAGRAQFDDSGYLTAPIADPDVISIRALSLNNDSDAIRFILQLRNQRGYDIQSNARGVSVQLVNNLYHISQHRDLNRVGVEIASSEKPNYNVSYWQGDVIVDLFDTKLTFDNMGTRRIDIAKAGVDYVSFSQLDARPIYGEDRQVARVVFHLSEGSNVDQAVIKPTDKGLFVYIDDDVNQVVEYLSIDDKESQLIIAGKNSEQYQLSFDKAHNSLQLYVPDSIDGLDDIDYRPNDAIVRQITVEKQGRFYLVNLQLEDDVSYVESYEQGYRLTLRRTASEDRQPSRKIIVIDAGHGGKDPGALSPDKSVFEKTIAFDAALQLKEKLENYGFTVYMTRDYDVYVDLYARSGLANSVGADLFISIHANSTDSSSVSGIETLYVDDERNSKRLATLVQAGMIEMTGAVDRGIVKRPRLVVIRETAMPAVIVEMGFMSNAAELEKLLDHDYINQVISGVYTGILRYFE